MTKRLQLTGKQFDRLTATKYLGGSRWECVCTCGVVVSVTTNNLTKSRVRSCGCLRLDGLLARSTKHGHNRKGIRSVEYGAWANMIDRCENPARPEYHRYGGRGITVCKAWRDSFAAFFADMGKRPNGAELDRKDNEGNYEPSNCRWADKVTQSNNRSDNRLYEAWGETKSLTQWVKDQRVSVAYGTLYSRINTYGWSEQRAMEEPMNKLRRRKE